LFVILKERLRAKAEKEEVNIELREKGKKLFRRIVDSLPR